MRTAGSDAKEGMQRCRSTEHTAVRNANTTNRGYAPTHPITS